MKQKLDYGFYQVKLTEYDKWSIGERYKNNVSTYWRLLGDDIMWGDWDFYEIGEKIEKRYED